jgi:hypothetical protein
MRSRQEKTSLVVNSVPFGHEHSINPTTFTHSPSSRKIAQGTVEFGQLINGFISDKGFADEENLVRIIHRHQLGKGPHQRLDHPVSRPRIGLGSERMQTYLIILHPASSVNQNNIKVIIPG